MVTRGREERRVRGRTRAIKTVVVGGRAVGGRAVVCAPCQASQLEVRHDSGKSNDATGAACAIARDLTRGGLLERDSGRDVLLVRLVVEAEASALLDPEGSFFTVVEWPLSRDVDAVAEGNSRHRLRNASMGDERRARSAEMRRPFL